MRITILYNDRPFLCFSFSLEKRGWEGLALTHVHIPSLTSIVTPNASVNEQQRTKGINPTEPMREWPPWPHGSAGSQEWKDSKRPPPNKRSHTPTPSEPLDNWSRHGNMVVWKSRNQHSPAGAERKRLCLEFWVMPFSAHSSLFSQQ